MRYEQTRNILQHLAPEYHRAVSRYFEALSEGDVSPRVRLMLDYLVDHEGHRALALGEYCRDAPHHVLDQWFKGIEINFPEAGQETIEEGAGVDLDLLVKAAVGYKRTLVDYYAYLIDHAENAETLDLFQTLKAQEEKAMKRMIRHAQGLADL